MSEEKHPHSPPPHSAKQNQSPAPAASRSDDSSRPVTKGQQKRRQRSVFQYIAILFGAAFVLLLFTFMMEKRQYDLLQQQNQEQIDDLQQSVSAVQSLQNLYDQNDALKEQVESLEDKLAEAEARAAVLEEKNAQMSTQLTNTSQAMDWFWQIDEAYVRGKNTLCRSLISKLEEAGLEEFLPKESITSNDRFSPYDRYQEIYSDLF